MVHETMNYKWDGDFYYHYIAYTAAYILLHQLFLSGSQPPESKDSLRIDSQQFTAAEASESTTGGGAEESADADNTGEEAGAGTGAGTGEAEFVVSSPAIDSSLFVFTLRSFPALDKYRNSTVKEATEKVPYELHTTVDKRVAAVLTER